MPEKSLPTLTLSILSDNFLGSPVANYPRQLLDLPVRAVQFGEGNFLRAFVDWIFHQMNKAGVFNGRITVIQPIRPGRVPELNAQDGLYTTLLRGIQGGEVTEEREIIPTLSHGLEAYPQWDQVLSLAEKKDLQLVISNTTEAGITYNSEDRLTSTPPESFPGKLTAFLYHRFQHFDGREESGLVMLPVELIKQNGSTLKEMVLKLAGDWQLPDEFTDWVNRSNIFLNTLVDRIVPGYPAEEAPKIQEELGYRDANMVAGEIYHQWYIEGDSRLRELLPFHQADLNVKWVDDLQPYRTRKVRILNGLHTSTVPVAFLGGIDTVRDAVQDEMVSSFMQQMLEEEIIPVMDDDPAELRSFGDDVFERFNNPFIAHQWLDISLNSISKFTTRVMPSLRDYFSRHQSPPPFISFSLAALLAFYRGEELRDGVLIGTRENQEYAIRDDDSILRIFQNLWQDYDQGSLNLSTLVSSLLGNEDLWGENLNRYGNLTPTVTNNLRNILNKGLGTALADLLSAG